MGFKSLQARLVAYLHRRIQTGEITERGLARLIGLSQPHLHNVLKGTRFLSMEMADQIVERLQIDLLAVADGLEPGESNGERPVGRMVPFLEGSIGPGHPYPRKENRRQGYPFQAADLLGMEAPVAAWLAPDAQLGERLGQGGLILLDRSENVRYYLEKDSYYVLDLGGESAVRRVKQVDARLYVREPDAQEDDSQWPWISLEDRELTDVIKGRVCALVLRL